MDAYDYRQTFVITAFIYLVSASLRPGTLTVFGVITGKCWYFRNLVLDTIVEVCLISLPPSLGNSTHFHL